MPDLRYDLRLALRGLARRPGFCAVVVLTLGLGIGAASATFSVVNAVLIKPLPYRAPEQLATLWSRWVNFDKTWLSAAEYVDYRALETTFADAGAWNDFGETVLTGEGDPPLSVAAAGMTANLLEVLGVAPAHGRAFTEAEDVPNGPAVAMLGHDLWQQRFGGDPALVGRTVQLDGNAVLVVGILPRTFRLPSEFQARAPTQVIRPLAFDRAAPNRGNHGYLAVGRLHDGVHAAQATLAMQDLARQWTRDGLYPESMRFTAFALPITEDVSGNARMALNVLAAAVGLLLLLMCVNVANLMLTRADGRHREVAVRTALGASRADLVRLHLTESLLLGVAGGALGLALAWAGVKVLVARAPTTIPRLADLTFDPMVVGFTLLVALATGLIVGLAPALRAARGPLADSLREGAHGQSASRATLRGRSMLVATEMALAVLLVIGAGLAVRSFRNLMAVSPGFDATNVLTLRLNVPASRYAGAQPVVAFYEQLADEVRRMPGVESAGFIRLLPLASTIGDAGVQIPSKPLQPGEPGRSGDWQAVTPGYFEAMRIPVLGGRVINRTDTPNGEQVIVVNKALAEAYFPGEDPVGQRMSVFGGPVRTIVGVVGDVHHDGLTTAAKRAWFVPHNQWANAPGSGGQTRRAMTMVVRTAVDPHGLLRQVEAAVHRMDPDIALTQVATLEDVLGEATREQRFAASAMSTFALLALILAAVGIYGVIAHAVGQRTREIGIRLALGADAAAVRALVLRQGMTPAVVGIAIGIGAAFLLTRYLRAILFGVEPVDPLTFAAMPVVLLLVAAGAVLIPARRASRIEPTIAMRS